jgi:hypothetical protein
MMDSELQEHIRKSALDKQLIRHVQSLLPADDAELDRWLADSTSVSEMSRVRSLAQP